MYRPLYSPECSALYFCTEPVSGDRIFSGACNVFVCGALQDPTRMSALLDLEPAFAPAAVTRYRRSVERIDGEDIPFMVPDPEDPRNVLTGVVWLDLTTASLEKLDSFELAGGFRKRISIEARVGDRKLSAYTYVKK